MKELFVSIRHAATTNAPIFITGETGTGKELVAKACHKESYQNMCLRLRFKDIGASREQLLNLWQQKGKSILKFASPVFINRLTSDLLGN